MDPEILGYYEQGDERERLGTGSFRIEFERTKELLERFLPPAPARVLDVGGGPGAYAAWLAERGYEVHLVDPVPAHVEQASEVGTFVATLGDARELVAADASVDAVLLLGPLYHLVDRADRVRTLTEARRVARPGGVVLAAAISRFASILDGLRSGMLRDPRFRPIVEEDLRSGQHRNRTDEQTFFTTAYFHRPEDLAAEIGDAGLELHAVLGVEGPGWLLEERWDDPEARAEILEVARVLEAESWILGTSSHLLAVARVPG